MDVKKGRERKGWGEETQTERASERDRERVTGRKRVGVGERKRQMRRGRTACARYQINNARGGLADQRESLVHIQVVILLIPDSGYC